MIVSFIFTKKAKKAFLKLPLTSQKRVIDKLKELKHHRDIFSVVRYLNDLEPATHRLRIGVLRLILSLSDQNNSSIKFLVLDVGHRKGVYR